MDATARYNDWGLGHRAPNNAAGGCGCELFPQHEGGTFHAMAVIQNVVRLPFVIVVVLIASFVHVCRRLCFNKKAMRVAVGRGGLAGYDVRMARRVRGSGRDAGEKMQVSVNVNGDTLEFMRMQADQLLVL